MPALVIHQHTERQLQAFIANPSHALLLHAPAGSGKTAIAEWLAARIIGQGDDDLHSYPYFFQIDAPAVSSEAIETVRKLEHFLSLRVPLPSKINRVVLISNAHALSTQAQNALLKTLEEPPTATLLIVTAPSQSSLLPTISSRLQAIAVKKPSVRQVTEFFTEQAHGQPAIEQAYAVSGGLPGLLSALLGDKEHPLRPATEVARHLLQGSLYDRLLLVEGLSKQKEHIGQVLFILQQMAHSRLQATSGEQFARWEQILTASYEASDQLDKSGQPKLILDSLMLKLT